MQLGGKIHFSYTIDNSNKNYNFDFAQLAYTDGWAESKPLCKLFKTTI